MLIGSRINTFTLLVTLVMTWETAGAHIPVTVKTSSGPVQGHIASKCFGVSEYLGIPFVCLILSTVSQISSDQLSRQNLQLEIYDGHLPSHSLGQVPSRGLISYASIQICNIYWTAVLIETGPHMPSNNPSKDVRWCRGSESHSTSHWDFDIDTMASQCYL